MSAAVRAQSLARVPFWPGSAVHKLCKSGPKNSWVVMWLKHQNPEVVENEAGETEGDRTLGIPHANVSLLCPLYPCVVGTWDSTAMKNNWRMRHWLFNFMNLYHGSYYENNLCISVLPTWASLVAQMRILPTNPTRLGQGGQILFYFTCSQYLMPNRYMLRYT